MHLSSTYHHVVNAGNVGFSFSVDRVDGSAKIRLEQRWRHILRLGWLFRCKWGYPGKVLNGSCNGGVRRPCQ
jgi:hypothetical protein